MKVRPQEERAPKLRPIERRALKLRPHEDRAKHRALKLRAIEICSFKIRVGQDRLGQFGAFENHAIEWTSSQIENVLFPIEFFGIVDLERLVNVEARKDKCIRK